ncbi:hypothetical protein Dimus_038191 [Dionaea muscipula]
MNEVKEALQSLWLEYKGGEGCSESMVVHGERMQGDRVMSGGGTGVNLFSSLFAAIDQQNEEEQLEEISNEVDKYLADKLESFQNVDFNLLDWWKGSDTRYPILTKIAKDVFAIPSSTVASESTFSLEKRIVDPFRSSLSSKMVEALVCTNDWLRAEDFCLYKNPTDEEIEFYREIEDIEASKIQSLSHFVLSKFILTKMIFKSWFPMYCSFFM